MKFMLGLMDNIKKIKIVDISMERQRIDVELPDGRKVRCVLVPTLRRRLKSYAANNNLNDEKEFIGLILQAEKHPNSNQHRQWSVIPPNKDKDHVPTAHNG